MRISLFNVIVLAAVLGGCSSGPAVVSYASPYPLRPDRVETLNIQVFRDARHIELTNTTARSFGASRIWLNARYSLPIEGLDPGESRRLKLSEFRDVHSDAFRGGGFFATEKPERLVLAELQDGEQFFGLIVVGGEGE